MTPVVRLLAAAGLAIATLPALAATTVYTSSASFLQNVAAGAYTNTFSVSVAQPQTASASYSQGAFGYTVAGGAGGATANNTYLSGSLVGTYYADTTLTVSFTAGNPTAVGGEFFITNAADTFFALPVTITLSDGTTRTFTPDTQEAAYVGFVSTVPITSLILSAPGANFFNSLDNLTVGVAAAVPEPGTWALMALGLAGLLAARRRRGD